MIRRKLEVDLGKHTETVLEECKPDDLIFQRTDIFRHFSPLKPHATNIHNVLEAMRAIPNFEEGRLFLANSFNLFLQNLLNRAPEILGAEPTIEMIEEIEETLTHVNSYQTEAIGKSYILNDIQVILAKTMQHVIEVRDSKRGFGGSFPFSGEKTISIFDRRANRLFPGDAKAAVSQKGQADGFEKNLQGGCDAFGHVGVQKLDVFRYEKQNNGDEYQVDDSPDLSAGIFFSRLVESRQNQYVKHTCEN